MSVILLDGGDASFHIHLIQIDEDSALLVLADYRRAQGHEDARFGSVDDRVAVLRPGPGAGVALRQDRGRTPAEHHRVRIDAPPPSRRRRVGVQVHQPGQDYGVGVVQGLVGRAGYVGPRCRDAAVLDRDAARTVQTGVGAEDPTRGDHQVRTFFAHVEPPSSFFLSQRDAGWAGIITPLATGFPTAPGGPSYSVCLHFRSVGEKVR